MNILIYKRTHNGDPGAEGVFGINDCMGRIRGFGFDAVLAIGGIKPWPGSEAIALKINWIGIGPKRFAAPPDKNHRGPWVEFEHFEHFFENGESVISKAPKLYQRMYLERRSRYIFSNSLPEDIQDEVRKIVETAISKPPSVGLKSSTKDGNVSCNRSPK